MNCCLEKQNLQDVVVVMFESRGSYAAPLAGSRDMIFINQDYLRASPTHRTKTSNNSAKGELPQGTLSHIL